MQPLKMEVEGHEPQKVENLHEMEKASKLIDSPFGAPRKEYNPFNTLFLVQ